MNFEQILWPTRVNEIAQALKAGFHQDMRKPDKKTDETAVAPSIVAEHEDGPTHSPTGDLGSALPENESFSTVSFAMSEHDLHGVRQQIVGMRQLGPKSQWNIANALQPMPDCSTTSTSAYVRVCRTCMLS